jgi:hypothetical protein
MVPRARARRSKCVWKRNEQGQRDDGKKAGYPAHADIIGR